MDDLRVVQAAPGSMWRTVHRIAFILHDREHLITLEGVVLPQFYGDST